MDSETDTSAEDLWKNEDQNQKPSTTALSTIVLNSKPIRLVVAILQVSLKKIFLLFSSPCVIILKPLDEVTFRHKLKTR